MTESVIRPQAIAIGGLIALLPESLAIFAPNANSYRRFKAHSYAPIRANWAVNNRTVALRVPAGPPESRHVEHRVGGADANPYLAMAALLAGIPLAFGSGLGSELRRPLGISMVGGLLLSQVLTLYTTPVIYIFFDTLGQRLTGRRPSHTAPRNEPPPAGVQPA